MESESYGGKRSKLYFLFENQGIIPVGGHTQVPRTYTKKLEPCKRDKGVVNPFMATCKSEFTLCCQIINSLESVGMEGTRGYD